MKNQYLKFKRKLFLLLLAFVVATIPSVSMAAVDLAVNISTVTQTSTNNGTPYALNTTTAYQNSTAYRDAIKDSGGTVDKAGGRWMNIVPNSQYKAGYVMQNKTFSVTSDFKITGYLGADRLVSNGSSNAGDWIGLVLASIPPDQVSSKGVDGGGLGIQGTPYSLAFGIDMLQNGNYNDPAPGPYAALRWTGNDGQLQPLGSWNGLYTNGINLTQWTPYNIKYTLEYHYEGGNGHQYLVGTLDDGQGHTWTMDTRKASSAGAINLALPSSGYWSIGINGSNGQSYQTMYGSFDSVSGTTYPTTVKVHYREDANPNTYVNNDTSFTTGADDIIGITGFTAGAKAGTNTYNFDGSVPATADAKYKSGWHLSRTVAWNNNNAQDITANVDASKNDYTLFYAPDVQQARVVTNSSDPTGAKTIETINGITAGTMSGWTKTDSDLVRAGYNYTVTGPSGTVYNTLAQAQNAEKTYDSTSNGLATTDSVPQLFTVKYSGMYQEARVITDSSDPSGAKTIETISGVSNGTMSGWTKTDTDLSQVGFTYKVTGPSGTVYNTLAQAQSTEKIYDATANGTNATDSNPQIFTVKYVGSYQEARVATDNSDPTGAKILETITGTSKGTMSGWTKNDTDLVRSGYGYKVTGPSGTVYDTLNAALTAEKTYDATNNGSAKSDSSPQIFIVSYTGSYQEARVATDSSDPTGAKIIETISGTSNGTMSGWTKTDSVLERAGHSYTVVGPDYKIYLTLAAAQTANKIYDNTANGTNTTDSNPQLFTVKYSGSFQQANVVTDSSDPSGAKTIDTINGISNKAISGWTKTDNDLTREGYNYTVAIGGESYPTLAAAQSHVTTFDNTDNGVATIDKQPQNFMVTYTKALQQARVNSISNNDSSTLTTIATYDNSSTPNSPLGDGTSGNLKSNVNDNALRKSGYTYTVTAPNGTTYPTMQEAWLATNTWDKTDNPVGATADSNPQVWTVNYIGQNQVALLDKTSTDNQIEDGNIETANGPSGSKIIFNTKNADLVVANYAYKIKVYDGNDVLLGTYLTLSVALNAHPNYDDTDNSVSSNSAEIGVRASSDDDTEAQRFVVEYTPTTALVNYNYVDTNGNVIKSADSNKQTIDGAIDVGTQPTITGYTYDHIDTAHSDADMKVNADGLSKIVYVYRISDSIIDDANEALDNADNSNVANESSVMDATKKLEDILNSATGTPQQIQDAITALNDAVSQAQTDRQNSIDAANTAKANTAPVSNEVKTKNGITDLDDVINDPTMTTEDIIAATDALKNEVIADKTARQTALDSANKNITKAQNDVNDSQDPTVQAAIANLQTVMQNAANDQANALTQDVINATKQLTDAMASVGVQKSEAISNANTLLANTSPVSHESDVATAITNLKAVLDDDTATTQSIIDATTTLQTALDNADSDRDVANTNGINASQLAENSTVANEQAVIDAYNKLQNTMQQAAADDANNLTANIIADTQALNDALTQATNDRNQATSDANTAMSDADASTVNNEVNVINEKNNLEAILDDPSSTTQQIKDATTALNNAVAQADNDRENAIDNANQEKDKVAATPPTQTVSNANSKLDSVMNDPSSTTQDIIDATNALADAINEASAARSEAAQQAADAKAPSKTAPVTNEPNVAQAITNINDLIQDPTSTPQQLADATTELNNAVAQAKKERDDIKNAANSEESVVNASAIAQEPSVVAAKQALDNAIAAGDADSPAGTTQAIKDAITDLDNAKQVAQQTRNDALQSITNATNSVAKNEASVQDKVDALKAILNNPTSTNQSIADATQELNDAVTQATADYDTASADLQQAIADANNSTVANEPSVQNQIDNAQKILDDPNSSVADLESAKTALDSAVSNETTKRNDAKEAAQQQQESTDNSSVKNESSVSNANDNLTTILNDPNSTTQDIVDATKALNDATNEAQSARDAANRAANDAISNSDSSAVNNEQSVSDAKNNLNDILSNPNSTTQQLQDATTALNDAVSQAETDRNQAKQNAQDALDKSNSSSSSTDTDVTSARDNLNDILNNPNSTTDDINNATSDLNDKVEAAEKADAIDLANEILEDTDTAPVSYEKEVVETEDDLHGILSGSSSTGKTINDAVSKYVQAVADAKKERNDAISAAIKLQNEVEKSKVAKEPNIVKAMNDLKNVIAKSKTDDATALTQDIKVAQKILSDAYKEALDIRESALKLIKETSESASANNESVKSALANLEKILADPTSSNIEIINAMNKVKEAVKNSKIAKLPDTGSSTILYVELGILITGCLGVLWLRNRYHLNQM